MPKIEFHLIRCGQSQIRKFIYLWLQVKNCVGSVLIILLKSFVWFVPVSERRLSINQSLNKLQLLNKTGTKVDNFQELVTFRKSIGTIVIQEDHLVHHKRIMHDFIQPLLVFFGNYSPLFASFWELSVGLSKVVFKHNPQWLIRKSRAFWYINFDVDHLIYINTSLKCLSKV